MMLHLQIFLQLLNIIELMLNPSFVLLLALAAVCPEQLILLYLPAKILSKHTANTISPLLITVAINSAPAPRPHPSHLERTIWHPSLPLTNFSRYILKLHISALPPHLRTKYSPYLHGAAFASIVADLFADEPSPIVREMGLEVDDASRKRARFLASLPEVVETGPEDGNRLPEPGQRGGRERVVFEAERLQASRMVARAGKEAGGEEEEGVGEGEADVGVAVVGRVERTWDSWCVRFAW